MPGKKVPEKFAQFAGGSQREALIKLPISDLKFKPIFPK
jgi:hypothetical protein